MENSTPPVHLFDGRVLACYLLSQLQFIDPLNRRDLTREELVNLDQYLERHDLRLDDQHDGGNALEEHGRNNHTRKKAKKRRSKPKKGMVVEAYDAKGMSVSAAGVAGQTAAGRAELLQQQAQVLLDAFLNGPGEGGSTTTGAVAEVVSEVQSEETRVQRSPQPVRNRFAEQYAASQGMDGLDGMSSQPSATTDNRRTNTRLNANADPWTQRDTDDDDNGEDTGIYISQGGGMILIDTDVNPGLRSGLNEIADSTEAQPVQDNRPLSSVSNPTTFWSGGDIRQRYGREARTRASQFPSLASTMSTANAVSQHSTRPSNNVTTNPRTTSSEPASTGSKKSAPFQSLSKIGSLVKKTDPKILEKQRKAREEAKRRAELANQPYTFGSDHDAFQGKVGFTGTERTAPSEAQLERNRKLASALGVNPSTARPSITGWARPVEREIDLDEFGNELSQAQYPDSLIIKARERMGELLKLERKWKNFLEDDRSASCPLKAMDRPTRIFVHEYSDFWKLHTQSFDPEPRRYIHCVKLLETSAPYPLLSDAVRTWRGPTPGLSTGKTSSLIATQQAAGQTTMSMPSGSSASENRAPLKLAHRDEERAPLQLAPRTSTDKLEMATQGALFGIDSTFTPTAPDGIKGPASATQEAAPRFAPLLAERERPRIQLEARTKPLELPPFQAASKFDPTKMQRQIDEKDRIAEEKRNKLKEREQSILAYAFASDDESEESGSDWEVGEALYESSDDD